MKIGLRILGILLIAWIPACIGFWKSRELRRRQKELDLLRQALSQTENAVRYYRTPIQSLLETMAESHAYPFLDSDAKGDELMASASERIASLLSSEITSARVLGFLYDLSSQDAESALNAMEAARQSLDSYADAVKKSTDTKAALYQKLGLLASAFLITLFI